MVNGAVTDFWAGLFIMGRTFYNIKSLGTVVDNGYPNNKLIQACFVGIKLNIVKNIFNLYMYFIKTDIKFIGIYKVYTKKRG